MKFKKGDIVVRISYNKDIIFVISNIIKLGNKKNAILKGLSIRIEADSPLEDLELININKIKKEIEIDNNFNIKELKRNFQIYGSILHLDGDKRYSEKSLKYYKNEGLNVTVKNVPEYKQPQMICDLLDRYNPDILVITGHDGMIKRGYNYSDINNYRNSRYFVDTVIKARRWEKNTGKMSIFAGACQSYYEALIEAGANFASSPARILIDFKDPLIVAQQISITNYDKYITIEEIKEKLRDEDKGISGIGSFGKRKK